MQTYVSIEEMTAAAHQLARTECGRSAMGRLIQMLDGDDLNLDFLDRRAFLALLGGAWAGQGDKIREIVNDALNRPAPPASEQG